MAALIQHPRVSAQGPRPNEDDRWAWVAASLRITNLDAVSLYWTAQACFLEQINHFATALAFSKRVLLFYFLFARKLVKNENHKLFLALKSHG